jgi:hypothetical protein
MFFLHIGFDSDTQTFFSVKKNENPVFQKR